MVVHLHNSTTTSSQATATAASFVGRRRGRRTTTLPITFLLLWLMTATTTMITTTNAQCPTMIWSDEFDGTSLDETKWSPQIGNGCDLGPGMCGWGNNEVRTLRCLVIFRVHLSFFSLCVGASLSSLTHLIAHLLTHSLLLLLLPPPSYRVVLIVAILYQQSR